MGANEVSQIQRLSALAIISLFVATSAAGAASEPGVAHYQPPAEATPWPAATPTADPSSAEAELMPLAASSSSSDPIFGRGIDPSTFTATYYNGPRISGTNFTEPYLEPIDWIRTCFGDPFPWEACELHPDLDEGGNYGVRWQADLIVPMDGTYTFLVEMLDNAVKLFVDEALIVDAGWNFPGPDTIGPQNTVALSAGAHELRIDYAQDTPAAAFLTLAWAGPGFSFEVIPLFVPYDCTPVEAQLSLAAQVVRAVVPGQNFCGNSFEELVVIPTERSGEAAFELFADLASNARSEVNFSTMSWHFDQTPSQMIVDSPGEIFLEGVRELYLRVVANQGDYPLGMKVRILLGLEHYALGRSGASFGADLRTAVLENLRDLGIPLLDSTYGWELQVAAYRDSSPFGFVDFVPTELRESHHSHAKLLVVDNAIAMAVGYNMEHIYLDASEFSTGTDSPFHDMGILVAGPVATETRNAFDDLWNLARGLCEPTPFSTYFPVPPNLGTCTEYFTGALPPVSGLVATGSDNAFSLFRRAKFPEDLSDEELAEANDAIVAAIAAAQSEANIMRPRLMESSSGGPLLPYSDAMKTAIVQNGAVVRLLLSAFLPDYAANLIGVRLLHQELTGLGLDEMFQPRVATPHGLGIHTKALSVDGDLLIVGSHNFDPGSWPPPEDLRGLDLAEYSIAVDSQAAIQEFNAHFLDQWNSGSELLVISFPSQLEEFFDEAFDEIGLLLPGIYNGGLFTNGPVRLIGAGSQESIIDCGGQGTGLTINESDVVVSNLWIRNCSIGIQLVDISPASLENIRISRVVFEDNTRHLSVLGDFPGSPVSFNIENNTFVGGSIGVELSIADQQPDPSGIRNNIFQHVAFPISILQGDGSNTEFAFNLFNGCEFDDCSTNWLSGTLGAGSTAHDNMFDIDPAFENQFASDFRLRFDSPAIDAADSRVLDLVPDMEGLWVVLEGDGEEGLSIDMGAFEAETPGTNHSPHADADGPYIANEGDPVLLSASGSTDPDFDQLTYTWDFDRNLIWDISNSTDPDAVFVWTDDFSGQAVLKVDDEGGRFDEDFAEVQILNVAPTVDAGPDLELLIGQQVEFLGSFDDPGSADTHTLEWDFGDGGSASGSLTPSHIFTSAGIYEVSLTVTDDDGGIGTDTLVVRVSAANTVVIEAARDSFLRPGNKNTNEGANPGLSIKESGTGREVVVGFDLSGVTFEGLVSATLVLTIDSTAPPGNWGPAGHPIDVHRLIVDWVEGNGKNSEIPSSEWYRGDGAGITWNCATDSDIANQNSDCNPTWNGGDYVQTATDSALHLNGMVGEVQWNITEDVLAGADSWLLRRAPGGGGSVLYVSSEGNGPGPKLILEYAP
jgi:PKD repeat protein